MLVFLRARRARRIPRPPRKSVEPRLALGVHRRATSALHADPPSEPACGLWREGQVLGVIVLRIARASQLAVAEPEPTPTTRERRAALFALGPSSCDTRADLEPSFRAPAWMVAASLRARRDTRRARRNRVSQQACTALPFFPKTMGGKKGVWPRIKLVTARPQGRRIGARNWASLNPWGSGTLYLRRTR